MGGRPLTAANVISDSGKVENTRPAASFSISEILNISVVLDDQNIGYSYASGWNKA